ncbi:uncharacterized protein Tco025E_08217, partial [Trypanosoma conorhini]
DGSCAAASVKCVTGAQLIFHGTNFNPLQPSYNDVVVGDDVAANPILCRLTAATETELTCVLSIPRDKEHGTYPIRVRIRASGTEWGAAQGAGFLVLGAGEHVPGWKPNDVPQPVPVNDEKKSNTALVVGLVLGSIILVLLLAIACLYFRPFHKCRKYDECEVTYTSP